MRNIFSLALICTVVLPTTCKKDMAELTGPLRNLAAPGRRGRTYPSTLIGILAKPSRATPTGSWITRRSNAIRELSTLAYREMKQRHRLV